MIWIARYNKLDNQRKVIQSKIGNFVGGNSGEVISRVCNKLGLHTPPNHEKQGCRCEFVTPEPQNPESLETHIIEVSPLDGMIDL